MPTLCGFMSTSPLLDLWLAHIFHSDVPRTIQQGSFHPMISFLSLPNLFTARTVCLGSNQISAITDSHMGAFFFQKRRRVRTKSNFRACCQ